MGNIKYQAELLLLKVLTQNIKYINYMSIIHFNYNKFSSVINLQVGLLQKKNVVRWSKAITQAGRYKTRKQICKSKTRKSLLHVNCFGLKQYFFISSQRFTIPSYLLPSLISSLAGGFLNCPDVLNF